ncbi:hypothetical protein BH09BAC2_BH09BAC2_05500 [soil metagenome]
MQNLLRNIYYSFPIQLLILHFRKYQILLLIWYILFSTIAGGFMKVYGADALFLAPEYLGKVNAAGAGIIGIAAGIFIMSWNITTFILHSHRFTFLATATKPFLKYCVNNAILPLAFLIFYFFEAYHFSTKKELITDKDFVIMAFGFMAGFLLLVIVSFAYFFTADRRIIRSTPSAPLPTRRRTKKTAAHKVKMPLQVGAGLQVGYYISTQFKLRQARDVSHYGHEFIDGIFKRHHFAAVASMILAFVFMIIVGFFLDHKIFQVPAAASIIIFFSIMIALIGTLAYFLQSWSVLFVILLFFVLNYLFTHEIIDPRNKAYGLNYSPDIPQAAYNAENLENLCVAEKTEADKKNMISILDKWKLKQKSTKPVMIFLNVSGGGVRSSTFVMDVLQRLDSISNGEFMKHTFLISGASGGMLAATYFRELYKEKMNDSTINLRNPKYSTAISGDLLNPVFSSMVSRDIFSPTQKFSEGKYRYIKDRGYSFEERLSDNTDGALNKKIGYYYDDELNARLPLIIFNSVVTADGRKMMVSTQPISFLMRNDLRGSDTIPAVVDAVDFGALFSRQDPLNLRVLTALRMNATFPYILPNVWLPSRPVIDVMDAGIRDNYGQETSLRFIHVFKDWLKENTGGVLMVQIRDRPRDGWEKTDESTGIGGLLTTPATIFQNNWYKLQDYSQNDQFSYVREFSDSGLHRVTFMYLPEKPDKRVPLNFHITNSEKAEVRSSLDRKNNMQSFEQVRNYFMGK